MDQQHHQVEAVEIANDYNATFYYEVEFCLVTDACWVYTAGTFLLLDMVLIQPGSLLW